MERPPAWRDALVVSVLALMLGLIVRSHVTQDHRYGFAMFHTYIDYRLSYAWVHEDGGRTPFEPGRLLSGWGKKLDTRKHGSIMGPHATRLLVGDILPVLYRRRAPDDAVGVECRYRWWEHGASEPVSEVIAWP